MEVQRNKEVAKCRVCGVELTDKNWYPSHKKVGNYICIACRKLRSKQYNAIHKKEMKEYNRFHRYGITIQQELDMLKAQGNKCAICGAPLTNLTEACIDHNHKTGEVRGILCRFCNIVLGHYNDNPGILIKAAAYLRNKGVTYGNQK